MAMARQASLVAFLALAAVQGNALSLGAIGGHMVTPLNNATTPVSMTEVFNRFRTTQAQIDNLTKSATDLQEEINEVKAIAQKTAAGVVQAEKDMAAVNKAAEANTATRMSLQAESKNFYAAVELGLSQVQGMQKLLQSLETAAGEMGSDGQAVAKKVAELDMKVEELLPGVGGISDRIKKVEDTAKSYSSEADVDLDKQIATTVKETFNRETERVSKLADEQIASDDGRDDADEPGPC